MIQQLGSETGDRQVLRLTILEMVITLANGGSRKKHLDSGKFSVKECVSAEELAWGLLNAGRVSVCGAGEFSCLCQNFGVILACDLNDY